MAIAVFPDRMNRIDPQDTEGSFRTLDTYIRYMVDQVEFAMSNSFRTTNGLETSGAETAQGLARQTRGLDALTLTVSGKVDKVEGKGLSTNDYTDEDKADVESIDGIETRVAALENRGGEANVIEIVKRNGTALPVSDKAVDVSVPVNVSELANDSGYLTQETDPTVPSWAKAASKPTYTAQEVGALPSSTVIPSKTSDLTNDSGYQNLAQVQAAVAAGVAFLLASETYGPAAMASFDGVGDGLPLKSCLADIQPVQAGSGDPSPTNIRPITGWTGVNVSRSGADTGNPTVYPVSWQTEAGTVYGGTVDVVSGALRVDKAAVDLGSLRWTYERGLFRGVLPENNSLPPQRGGYAMQCLCSVYAGSQSTSLAGLPDKHFLFNTTSYSSVTNAVIVRDSGYTDASVFVAAVAGQTLVYPLAEPVTYQLTPRQVTALRGDNNVWADCGNVTVEYGAFLEVLQAEIEVLMRGGS